jgi:NTE family protein
MTKTAPRPSPSLPQIERKSTKSFALALGGGGARGLAHVAVIEALDDMGIKPVAIAGTSIGALVGAAYAAGMHGKDIRHYVTAFAHQPGEIRRRLMKARAGTLAHFFSGAFSQATLMDAEKFCTQFLPEEVPADFSALKIPLTVMATDLHRRLEMPLSKGPLRPAVAASIAIPGLFRPMLIDGRVLIDGGSTNPLPFDRLSGMADFVVAVDLSAAPDGERVDLPSTWECVFTTLLVMSNAITAAKLAHKTPDVLLRPNVGIFRTLDFHQASAILRSAEATKAVVQERLGALLAG